MNIVFVVAAIAVAAVILVAFLHHNAGKKMETRIDKAENAMKAHVDTAVAKVKGDL